jgi:hypothetical protein
VRAIKERDGSEWVYDTSAYVPFVALATSRRGGLELWRLVLAPKAMM